MLPVAIRIRVNLTGLNTFEGNPGQRVVGDLLFYRIGLGEKRHKTNLASYQDTAASPQRALAGPLRTKKT
jgi:hypothetical protein